MAALVACALIPLVAGQLGTHFIIGKALKGSAIEKYRALCLEAGRQVEAAMNTAERSLRTLADNPILVQAGYSNAERIEEMKRIARVALFTDISLYERSGILFQSTSMDYTDFDDRTEWFRRARDGQATLSAPQKSLAREDHLDISVYFPTDSRIENKSFVVKGRVCFDPVWDLLDNMQLGKGGLMVLLDDSGNVLSHPNKELILSKFRGPEPDLIQKNETGVYRDAAGHRWFWVSRHLPANRTLADEPWTLLALVPESEVLAVGSQSAMIQFLIGVATLIGAMGLGFWLARRVSSPLIAAANAANRVASGDMTSRISAKSGPTEIIQLAGAFNQMVGEVAEHRHRLEQLVAARTHSLKESQAQAEALSAQLRAAFESTREAILVVRLDGTIMAANGRFGDFFGLPASELTGASFAATESRFFACFADEAAVRSRWRRLIETNTAALDEEWEVCTPERRVLASYSAPVVSNAGEVLAHLWVFSDLTRQRELQESLEQAQKMEAIGRLAGGVAHDFNNLLTGIAGNLALAQDQLTEDGLTSPQPLEHLRQARTTADRAAQLVRGLLGFSRRSHLHLAQCDINNVLDEFYPLIRRIIEPRIDIRLDLRAELWDVRADKTKIEQIVMNLCINARDAIEADGEITIRTSNELVTSTFARRYQAQPGDYVCVAVTDTGTGVPPGIVDKIFEPFFTTKEPGKGTGLGLATSYGIVQQHGGWIVCDSEPGKGSTFKLYLPRDRSARERKSDASTPAAIERGTETILLVDDDSVVRLVAETLLKSQGYRVILADDGVDALDQHRRHQGKIDLVLLDMSMPRMSGTEAFRHLDALDPALPVVICSGYVLNLAEFETGTGAQPDGFVQKPYDFNDLLGTVRRILDRSRQSPPPNRSAADIEPALAR